jgi:hypothetical protein
MPERTPTTEKMPANEDMGAAIAWDEGRRRLGEVPYYWLTTLSKRGTPHTRPLLAIWLDGVVYTTSKETAVKGRNMLRNGAVSLAGASMELPSLDFVLEGDAALVTDTAELERVAEAYIAKYGWQVTPRDGKFDAAFGAPTADEPPFSLFRLTPRVIYAFPGITGSESGTNLAPTRWRFRRCG